ncbi:amino acid ABC transporter ATP-binding protein [Blautia glucerasea]|uniref:amino acid ABC transporter ATP-binding protein n=1 Tax=Blautia glucerasea TaxID=536633 RepID=UPI0021F7B05E|nr:amino acid ABC transporter ATP-binding protein [Blautia glucerasea]
MAEDVILSVKNISKSFGDLQVLKEISFDIHKGEKIAILGPSGSGKSTILRCINQLETYDDGEIDYMGKPVNSGQALYELRQHIGMVFQRFNVFTHMSVLQNVIEAPVHVKKVPKQEAIAKAKELLKMVGLEGREGAMAKNLSGGQQQRVAIARAMAMNPEVILFDEPTSALDPELVGEVLSVIRKVAAEGVSMVIVTHEMNFAREVADRILFMEDGVIVEDAPPEEFFEHPKNDRIRQFIRKVEER